MPKKELVDWNKYWYLTVLEEVRSKWYSRCVLCLCECWNEKEILLWNIKQWKTISCWCKQKEIVSKRNKTHWMRQTKFYSIWTNINTRCKNPNATWYKYYGGRWIKCEWQTFEEFYKDMWIIYKEWLTIERRDVNLNYCKSNCTWITSEEQQRNKRTNIIYKWKCLKEYCRDNGLNYKTITSRIYRWSDVDKAIKQEKVIKSIDK